MISIASTQLRTLPDRTDRGPAALVDTMPPDVANAPEEGSGGKRSPNGCPAAVSSAQVVEAPAHTVWRGQLGAIQRNPRLRSTTTPCPTLPPAIPLPAPRGTNGTLDAAAQRTSRCSSSTPRGTATAAGRIRYTPAPSA